MIISRVTWGKCNNKHKTCLIILFTKNDFPPERFCDELFLFQVEQVSQKQFRWIFNRQTFNWFNCCQSLHEALLTGIKHICDVKILCEKKIDGINFMEIFSLLFSYCKKESKCNNLCFLIAHFKLCLKILNISFNIESIYFINGNFLWYTIWQIFVP
jgi:hypothetical protein